MTAREIKHWNLRTGEADIAVALRNDGATSEEFAHLTFTPDYKHLASVQSYDDRFTRNTRQCLWRVSLWDAVTGEPLVNFPGRRSNRVGPALLSPNAKTLAIGSDTGILLYGFNGYLDSPKTHGGAVAEPLALKSRGGQVWSLAFSPDGKALASTWARDANIWLWDVETCRNIHTLKRQGHSTRVAFSPDGETLAAKDEHHVVKLWNWPLDSSK